MLGHKFKFAIIHSFAFYVHKFCIDTNLNIKITHKQKIKNVIKKESKIYFNMGEFFTKATISKTIKKQNKTKPN
jgi:hypothetical protein